MKDIVNVAVLFMFIMFCGLLVSMLDSCQAYSDCLKAHSEKTCKAHFGRGTEPDEDDY